MVHGDLSIGVNGALRACRPRSCGLLTVARRAALVVAAGRLHHGFVYVEFGRRRWLGRKLTAPPTQWPIRRRLVPTRGAYHDRHERGMGCGGRGSVGAIVVVGRVKACERPRSARRTTLVAYGKTVWSWHPLLMSSLRKAKAPNRVDLRRQFADDGDKT